MNSGRIISFEVCANGDLKVKVPEGKRLVIDQTSPNEIRVSSSLSIGQTAKVSRPDAFEVAAKIGDVMEDGSIYAGISPTNDHPFFVVAPENMRQMRRTKALAYIREGTFHSHEDWRMCSPSELAHLWNHRREGMLEQCFDRRRKYHWTLLENGDFQLSDRDGESIFSMSDCFYFFPIRHHLP